MAILMGGALLIDRETDSGGMSDDLDGFLSLSWHGAHAGGVGAYAGLQASIDIARDTRGGQFEIYFCSTDCLRAYLNFCVDKLEQRVKEQSKNTEPSAGGNAD
ncbi:MAG TPA: hypothetical protein VEC99_16525 [Clostridia bacterium]|nr:hypothetical protein [Clostridia bacterium]